MAGVVPAMPQEDMTISPPPERAAAPRFASALVIFNEKAGSVQPGDHEKLVEHLTEAGIERYAVVGADQISESLFARAPDFDLVIVLGGDGTAQCAAALAPRDSPPLVLLPGGTLNILPHALYGQLAWPEALKAALERGVEKRMPAGTVNGERFFVAAMFGAPTVLARAREAAREGDFLKAFGRIRHFFKRAFMRRLRARYDQSKMRKTEAIGVLLPAFGGLLEGEEGLEWVRLDARHVIDLARVSLRALGEGWRKDSAVEIARCMSGDIAASGIIPATIDGEPRTYVGAVRVEYDPNGVRVLALEPEPQA